MSKRRRGYPSESRVKRPDGVVHGNNELIRETWMQRSVSMRFGRTFKNCCLPSGRFDESLRNYYRCDR